MISRDVSDRKHLERQIARLDRLTVIGEMAAGISHEVRNPLTTVRGFLQRLSEKTECNSFKEYFEIMIGEIDRANSIISEFLTIGRTHAPGRKVHNLNTIVSVLYPLIEADAIGQDKRVLLELDNVPNFFVDDKEIRQIILNLARNGLEAMTAGGVLTLKTYTKAEQVVLSVQDKGCGIPPYVMEKIGTPFFTTKEQGTGLGLAVCYGIASRHKASIHIDSSSSGTTMSVKFPSYIESV